MLKRLGAPGSSSDYREVPLTFEEPAVHRWRWIGLAATVVAVIIAGAILPVRDTTLQWADAIQAAGLKGILVFVAAYVASTVFILPGSLLTLLAGFAYGPVYGLLIASPTSVLAAAIAFLLARSALREIAQRRIATSPAALAINRAVRQDGFKLVLLLRLSPLVPFNILNYALGLSEVPLGTYVAASFLGMLPGTWMYVYLGSLATTAADLSSAGEVGRTWRIASAIAGLIITTIVIGIVSRAARRTLAGRFRPGGTQ